MEKKTLEHVIRKYVQLSPPNSKGWESCIHLNCDHGRKGPRAAFLFDKESVFFHCFNCEKKPSYIPNEHEKMYWEMEEVLRDFGIPEEEWQEVLLYNLEQRDKHGFSSKTSKHKKQTKSIEPPEIFKPKTFYDLQNAKSTDKWAEIARLYLQYDRGIDPDSYPFMLSPKTGDLRLDVWVGRIIIPVFKDNKLIYYSGRDLTGKKQKKYLSSPTPKHNVIYGFDQLLVNRSKPLYVVEGWFDAFKLDGVAIFGRTISDEQVQWLNRSPRKKVYVPDRFGDGKGAALTALSLGWSVATPDIGEDIKDMDEAIQRYGKLYVIQSLAQHTATGFEAEANLEIYCKYEPSRKGKKNNNKPSRNSWK